MNEPTPEWMLRDIAQFNGVPFEEPAPPEQKKERATRKPTTEKAVKE